jgi:hydroxymethylglutaryl-CoA lyase
MFRRFVCSGNSAIRSAFVREFSSFPATLRIVEVGPRDGLQNEPQLVPTEVKIEFIEKLSKTGLRNIEATAFVSPKWVPQMGDNKAVMDGISKVRIPPAIVYFVVHSRASTAFAQMKPVEGLRYSALTPNMNGYKQALASGMQEVAVFGAASEAFSQKNINCSIAESLSKFHDIMAAARSDNILVRGYVSTVLGCPYSGKVEPQVVVDVASRLMDMCVLHLLCF